MIEKHYIIHDIVYNEFFIVDEITNNGSIKAHDKNHRTTRTHASRIIKYKAPGKPIEPNKQYNPNILLYLQ